jgi:hypothetical protein
MESSTKVKLDVKVKSEKGTVSNIVFIVESPPVMTLEVLMK